MALDVNELITAADERFGKQGRKLAEHYVKRASKLERKLEKHAKRLPVDTPLDRTRRARTARRSTRFVMVALVIGGGVVLYRAWKSRVGDALPSEAGPTPATDPAPDVFGNGVQRGDAEAFARSR